jgi:hypothetical protein
VFWGFVATLFGGAFLVAGFRAWTGRWRRWARRFATRQGAAPITLYPAIGFAAVVGGLDTMGLAIPSVVAVVCLLVLIVGWAFYFVTPKWWGPRWYRDRDRAAPPDLSDPLTAVAYTAVAATDAPDQQPAHMEPPAEFGAVLTSWRASWIAGDERAPAAHGLTHGGAIEGTLRLQERGLAFTSNRAEDLLRGEPRGQAIAASSVKGVRVVPRGAGPDGQPRQASGTRSLFARLVVDTSHGPYLFEVLRAKRAAQRIAEALQVEALAS